MGPFASKSCLQRWQSAWWFRAVGHLAVALQVCSLTVEAAPIPADKPVSYPAWWFEREVIKRVDPSSENPLWSTYSYPPADDYAVVNIGQLKQFATKAALELNVHLPGGAGLDVNNLVAVWTTPPSGGAVRDDFAAVNLGQVKSVAKLFYDKLIAWHYIDTYPWADGLGDDFALANLGQIKSLFAFDLTYDSDGDGIPDWWEFAAHLNPNDPGDASALATDGSGQTNAQRWLAGVNPATVNPVPPGTPAPGSGKPMLDLGTVTFAAIDVSSALTTADISDVAIDDQNHVAFAYPPENGSESLRTAVFADGVAGSVKIFPADGSVTIDDIVYGVGRKYTSLTASGAVAGVADYLGETGAWFARAFVSNGGSPTEIWPDVPPDALGIQPMGSLNPYSQDSYVTCGNAGWLSGFFESPYWGPLGLTGQAGQPQWEWLPDWHQPDEWVYFAYRNRDLSPARLASPAGTTAGYYALTPYWGLNFDPPNYGVCVAGGPVSIGQLYPIAVSDSGIVLGDNEALPAAQLSAGLDTVSVFDNDGATSLLSSHLPKIYQGKIRFPRSQSSAIWVNDHGDAIVEAEVYDETVSPTIKNRWLRRQILWRNALSMGTAPSTLSFVQFPSGASPREFNNAGNFAALLTVPVKNPVTGVVTGSRQTGGLLLPFEIRDVKDWDDANDDVLIEPKKDAKDTNIKSVAWIEPHKKKQDENTAAYDAGDDPRMPQLEVQFKGLPASVKVQWKFKCKYSRPSGRDLPEDEVKFPADGSFEEVTGDQPWKIHQGYNDKPFFGGDVELTYKIIGAGGAVMLPGKTDKFRIAGKNPADDRCRKYIDKVAADLLPQTTTSMWYAYAIAKSETKWEGGEIYYNQFLTNGIKYPRKKQSGETDAAYNNAKWDGGKGKEGVPNWNNDGKGKPGGYGVKQVTGWQGDDNGNVPRAVIWDWKTNVDEGMNELVGHHNRARKWMQSQRTSATKVLPSLTVSGVTFNDGTNRTMEDAVAMKNYNGSSRRSSPDPDAEPQPRVFLYTNEQANDGHYCYWDRGRNKWSLSRYNSYNPPFNYVVRVCDEVE